jgi:hypothetical protein
LLFAGTIVAMMATMHAQGRLWFSSTGVIKLWHSDVWSNECSQQWADPYSVTHVSHGVIFAGFFWWLAKIISRWGVTWPGETKWQVVAGTILAAGWEMLENSTFVIERYRTATMSLDYLGDSIFNAVGDLCSCGIGYFLARWIGLRWSIGLLVVSELLLLLLIRDNLTLNIIMLVRPIEAIKRWQMVGH